METKQQLKQKQREEFKKQESLRKHMNSVVTRREMYEVIDAFNRVKDRVFYLDIYSAALEKVLLDKGLVTREEIEAAFAYEGKRSAKFTEICNQQGNYIERLELCKEWNIDPSITTIPDHLLADSELTDEAKMKIATDYKIQRLIEIYENQKKSEAESEEEKNA